MSVSSVIHQASSLSIPERIRVVQAVWDSLPDDVGLQITPQQLAEINRRLAAHDADTSSAISREELERRLSSGN